ncbi:septation protein IspZ, partial [Corallococcus exiguus]|nr:septation protein IspZ [Corallococcus exiguus]
MKLLIDFFPIILFFVAFKVWGIYTATAVAIAATIAQIVYLRVRNGRVEPMQWVSLGVIVVFGGATLLSHSDTFIKWKPTVLYWLMGTALVVGQLFFRKN